MTSSPLKELIDADIKVFLESAPLYSWREFKKPHINRSSLWIREIDAYKAGRDLQSRPGRFVNGFPCQARHETLLTG
jgi:hypothetical protein